MTGPGAVQIDEWPQYVNDLIDYLSKNLDGFKLSMLDDYFKLSAEQLDDPLFNMTWGINQEDTSPVEALERLSKRINNLISNFMGKLGEHDTDLIAHLYATMKMADSSAEQYKRFFGHEMRGGVNWPARLVADLCFVSLEQRGRAPTFGTNSINGGPTGEYCRLVEKSLKAIGISADWNSPAKWVYKRNSKKTP